MLNVCNIYKNFGGLKVLKGVSTEIKKGEVVAIIGPSGSGKSTMLRCMNLLEVPTFGEVWMDEKLLTPVDPYLHFEVIRASVTYKKLIASGMEDMDAIQKIKDEDLLHERFNAEGKAWRGESVSWGRARIFPPADRLPRECHGRTAPSGWDPPHGGSGGCPGDGPWR